MKKILISIKPKYVVKILNGEKTLEIRKNAPKDLPCEVYIYCTKENAKYFIDNKIYNAMMKGKVVAKFTLNKAEEIEWFRESEPLLDYYHIVERLKNEELLEKARLTLEELKEYLGVKGYYSDSLGWNFKKGYAWHIDNLVIFDRPKELKEFKKVASKRTYTNLSWLEPSQKVIFKSLAPLTHAPQSWQFCEVDE